ncbi:MAG: peptidoglycan editing factor PgeF [Syntrophomonadaceae bacterium]|nr:peptidoglycan editing factor PgeF [Syntrophomonadaceae bacterium]
MQPWIIRDTGTIKYITLPGWEAEGVALAFSTRLGGVSQGIHESLNMGLHVEDQDELVLENRRRLAAVFDFNLDAVVCCQQVHGNQVAVVGEADRGRGAFRLGDEIPGCDALVTVQPGIFLLSFYADCVPLYLFDPLQRVVASAHCGWKGTMGRIGRHTIDMMNRQFGTRPESVWAFIGPGIGAPCFEINPDLAARVNAEFTGWHDIINRDRQDRYTWDLQETNARILQAAGVMSRNISICSLCTVCQPDLFFSYRREKGLTGRMAAVLGLQY